MWYPSSAGYPFSVGKKYRSLFTEKIIFYHPLTGESLEYSVDDQMDVSIDQVQSNANYYWGLAEVLSKLDVLLTNAYLEVADLAGRQQLSLRDAALAVAVDRVASACRERGWL